MCPTWFLISHYSLSTKQQFQLSQRLKSGASNHIEVLYQHSAFSNNRKDRPTCLYSPKVSNDPPPRPTEEPYPLLILIYKHDILTKTLAASNGKAEATEALSNVPSMTATHLNPQCSQDPQDGALGKTGNSLATRLRAGKHGVPERATYSIPAVIPHTAAQGASPGLLVSLRLWLITTRAVMLKSSVPITVANLFA